MGRKVTAVVAEFEAKGNYGDKSKRVILLQVELDDNFEVNHRLVSATAKIVGKQQLIDLIGNDKNAVLGAEPDTVYGKRVLSLKTISKRYSENLAKLISDNLVMAHNIQKKRRRGFDYTADYCPVEDLKPYGCAFVPIAVINRKGREIAIIYKLFLYADEHKIVYISHYDKLSVADNNIAEVDMNELHSFIGRRWHIYSNDTIIGDSCEPIFKDAEEVRESAVRLEDNKQRSEYRGQENDKFINWLIKLDQIISTADGNVDGTIKADKYNIQDFFEENNIIDGRTVDTRVKDDVRKLDKALDDVNNKYKENGTNMYSIRLEHVLLQGKQTKLEDAYKDSSIPTDELMMALMFGAVARVTKVDDIVGFHCIGNIFDYCEPVCKGLGGMLCSIDGRKNYELKTYVLLIGNRVLWHGSSVSRHITGENLVVAPASDYDISSMEYNKQGDLILNTTKGQITVYVPSIVSAFDSHSLTIMHNTKFVGMPAVMSVYERYLDNTGKYSDDAYRRSSFDDGLAWDGIVIYFGDYETQYTTNTKSLIRFYKNMSVKESIFNRRIIAKKISNRPLCIKTTLGGAVVGDYGFGKVRGKDIYGKAVPMGEEIKEGQFELIEFNDEAQDMLNTIMNGVSTGTRYGNPAIRFGRPDGVRLDRYYDMLCRILYIAAI